MNKIDSQERFAFGANWSRFLSVLDEERITESEKSLKKMLDIETLDGKTFLDIGSGSGLSSLAARRLRARVTSFDYDSLSVACTSELRHRYFPDDPDWIVGQASALDREYMSNLGFFDVVYSWGVLHHTGAMWLGIENAIQRVGKGGKLFIAIYNDQGFKTHCWWLVKYFYVKLPRPLNSLYAYSLGLFVASLNVLKYTLRLQPMKAIRPLIEYKKSRGMSYWHDLIDWMGGFPFEFATYQVLQEYMAARGFSLVRGEMESSLGCHQMVFMRDGKEPNTCAV